MDIIKSVILEAVLRGSDTFESLVMYQIRERKEKTK